MELLRPQRRSLRSLRPKQLLRPQAPASVSVTIMGRGRSVIGGAMNTQLAPDEVKQAADAVTAVVEEDGAAQELERWFAS